MSETLTRQPKIVSLSNLETSTPEEVFNHIAFHLLTQNKKAFFQDSQRCVFRTEEGLKCAAGALISDEEWFANENKFQMANTESWSGLIIGGKAPTAHEHLILALQEVHDAHSPEKWYDVLCGVALGLGFHNSILSYWNVPPVAFPPDTGTGLTQGYDFQIFFDDLNYEAQQRFLKFMGIDNPSEGNYDVIEIATVVFEDEEVGYTS